MAEVAPLVRRPVQVIPDESYQEIGIRSFGRGIFQKPRTTGLEIGDKRVFSIEPGDLLFNIVFAWEGAVAVASSAENGSIGSHRFLTCVAAPELADARYLYWWFVHDRGRKQLLRASPGGAGRNRTLGIDKLSAIEVPLPSLAAQRRIVAQVEQTRMQIHEASTLRDQAIEEGKALLAAYRRRIFGTRPQDDWLALSEYVASIESGKSPATEGRRATADEWGVLKVGAVSFGYFDETENKALPSSFVPPPSLEVKDGDFIMSRANTRELVGSCAVVRHTRPRLMLSDKTFRFVFRSPQRVLPEYLDQALKSPALRDQIKQVASGTSATMKNISKEKVLALRLPRHGPSEQHQIAAELQALQARLDGLKRLQTETAAELDALLPSVLNKTFSDQ